MTFCQCPLVIYPICDIHPGSLYIGVTGRSNSLTIWTLKDMDRVITEVLHIMVIFRQLFREMLELDEMIMRFRRKVVPHWRRKAPLTWVRQWLRRREDRGQCQISLESST